MEAPNWPAWDHVPPQAPTITEPAPDGGFTWSDNGTRRDVERIIRQSQVVNQEGRIRLDRAC
eukprot:9119995-Heterocapsa_arctica.AAC.1